MLSVGSKVQHKTPNNSKTAFLIGGEMGKRIHSKDWAKTPLGPVEDWPQNLRLALDICLESNSPISIFWGNDQVLLYNDACSKLIGKHHPKALGRPAREALGEEWKTISPMVKQVCSSGEAVESESTLLLLPKRGECYVDLSFSPIRNEDGSVGGVFSIATETTEHKQVEKRLKHIEKALQIETVGLTFFNAEGEITSANDAFLNMSGYSREDLEAGKLRWDEMTPPEWMETSENAIIELKETGTSTPYEKQYLRKDGSRWWALFSGKHLEDGNSVEFILDITKRKRTEQLLKQQKQLMELIAKGTPLDDCLSKLCKTVPQLNPGARAVILLADDQQKTYKRPIAPDFPESFSEGLNSMPIMGTCGEAILTGRPASCLNIENDEKTTKKWRDLCRDHDIGASYSEPIFNRDGQPVGAFMLCFDKPRKADEWEMRLVGFGTHVAGIAIERRCTEETLRQSEEKYRTLFDSIDEGFCIIEMIFDENDEPVDYLFLEANPAFERQSGLENVLGKTMRQLIPEHEDYWFEIYGKIALTGEPKRFESYTEKLSRWLDLYAFRIGDPQERKVAVIFNDITERKKANKEREQLLREVEAERKRLTDIFKYAPSIMAIMRGPDHVFEEVNDLYKQLAGNRDLIGKSVREAFPEVEGQGFFEILDGVYRTGKEFIGNDERILLRPQNGGPPEEHYINFVYQPLRDADGAITGVFAQGIDVTDRKQVENKLVAMNETLEERVEERTASLLAYQDQLRSLASQLSQAEEQQRHRLAAELHDNLGQMLAVGKMKADLLQKDPLPDQVASDVGELRDLVDDALMYTRELMSDLKPPPSLNKEDVRATIEWVAKKMEKHGLKVTIEDDEQPKQVSEEIQTTLLQAVRELLFNVIKHSRVDEARISISRLGNYVQVIVEDEGKGFDPGANKGASFEKGGFGLFNIRERMDLLGGSMEIFSEPGKGTKVKLLAPLKEEQKPEKAYRSDEVKSKLRTTGTEQKVKVLLVDDHEMMREGLRKIVDEQDDLMVIAEASDGKEAVRLAHETSPDVVVMDVNMPVMNGIDATEEITSQMPDLRIIGLSLHGHENVINSMRSAGASAYLTKNEAFETLSATIRSEARMAKKGDGK